VDMAKGEIVWKVPFGVLDKLMPVPVPLKWGTPAAGGPIITASGLIFIGATADARIHAFDVENGREIWVYKAPTAAQATPMTYMVNGRQYVVFAAGGHDWFYPKGISDYLLAFALPEVKH
jgi:quinoprotein glucose dehydrogenase